MYDLRTLDRRIRTWLKHVPLSAIVVLLKAIHDELKSRRAVTRSAVRSLASVEHRSAVATDACGERVEAHP